MFYLKEVYFKSLRINTNKILNRQSTTDMIQQIKTQLLV